MGEASVDTGEAAAEAGSQREGDQVEAAGQVVPEDKQVKAGYGEAELGPHEPRGRELKG